MLHGAVLLDFCQAFGHLAPFKKQIEVGTGWGWLEPFRREQSGCFFLRSWYPYIFKNQTICIDVLCMLNGVSK